MKMTNPVYTKSGWIDCNIDHPIYGVIPTTISPDDAENFQAALALKPAPYIAPPAPDPLDAERAAMVVSRFQARAALHLAGVLPLVETFLKSADFITQLAWAEAQEFRRNSPTIAALADGLGLDDAALDDLFRAAKQIEV